MSYGRVKRLATDPVVLRLNIVLYELLINQPKSMKFTLVVTSLVM